VLDSKCGFYFRLSRTGYFFAFVLLLNLRINWLHIAVAGFYLTFLLGGMVSISMLRTRSA
jgi:hypothetical protein